MPAPRILILRSWILLAGSLLCSVEIFAESASISFNRDVRPILSDHCFACHGFDPKKRQADLRLDTPEGAAADLGGYQAVVPKSPEQSALWKRITSTDSDDVMPPEEFHKPLSDQQKAILRAWIEQGAPYEKHWSFVSPRKQVIPKVNDNQNPIDAFIRDRLAQEGLSPNPEADKPTLIRRVTLDLTGLPPTPEEVDAFLANESPTAYEELIDTLQSRVTYGEHMARYWLDLARYADTHGMHLDNERSIWPYRDWVVRAINQNLPFDDFTRWQLAGDLLPDATQEQVIASGFNRCNVTTGEGGSINEEWIFRYAVDRTATTAEVWLGLTAGCAVCHDHKFDPLSAKEFYSMYAFFHSAADPAMDGNVIDTPPILKLLDDDARARAADLRAQLAGIDEGLTQKLIALDYQDPALAEPRPPIEPLEELWFEDGFPAGANLEASGGPALKLIGLDEGPVFSGELSLTRTSENTISQDFFTQGAEFSVPQDGKFFVHCFLDPQNPPEAIMVQFHTTSWNNRAVWGKQETIGFGKENTTEKVHLGALPALGEWVRLEMDAKALGLNAGTKVTGFAFTQFSGTVTWDHLGVSSSVNKAEDPSWSWDVWSQREAAQILNDLEDPLRRQLQGRTREEWTEEETQTVKTRWMREFYAGAREVVAEANASKAPLEAAIAEIDKAAPVTFVMADLPESRESFVMVRGAYDQPGEKVTRDVPAFLPPLATQGEPNRRDLADWLVSREHPLTARVTVNRFWQQFFGTGLVKTSADFGSQGQPPSHPELLDWLAVQFVEDGWDMKRLVKRIVTSHTYRQSSRVSAELLERDPGNRWLARAPRMRLDAEVLRDQALFVSGLLVPTVGGPGVKPYQPPNIWEPVGFGSSNTRYYTQGVGDDLYRRSLYTFLKRTAPPPFMSSFDAPNREQSCSVRGRSNTPMQALQLLNDIQHVEAARALAERTIHEGGKTAAEKIRWVWRLVTSREPTEEEAAIALQVLQEHHRRYREEPAAAQELISYGESQPDATIKPSQLAAFTMLANLILNLDESVSKN